jgi:hypothetical protein
MKKPETTKFNLDDRPQSYWGTSNARFANVKGEVRRRAIRQALAEGRLEEIPPEVRGDVLSPATREEAGRIHPSYMGGEYLLDYFPGEVEIARVALDSVTVDVTSVRARMSGGRIRYRAVDEYEAHIRVSPQSSRRPLTLRQLIRLIDTATCDVWPEEFVGLVCLEAHFDGANHERLAQFFHVSSAFYSELGPWYEEAAEGWLKRKRQELDEAG